MSEKAIVFHCKTCDALFFAAMQSVAGDYAQEIAEYLANGDRMEIVDPQEVSVKFAMCHCYDNKPKEKTPAVELPLFRLLEANL